MRTFCCDDMRATKCEADGCAPLHALCCIMLTVIGNKFIKRSPSLSLIETNVVDLFLRTSEDYTVIRSYSFFIYEFFYLSRFKAIP